MLKPFFNEWIFITCMQSTLNVLKWKLDTLSELSYHEKNSVLSLV